MDIGDALTLLDRERKTLERDGDAIDVLPSVTRLRAATGEHHEVIYSSLTAETADDTIDAEIRHYSALCTGFEWKVYGHDGPADLLDRLRRRGFEVGPLEAVLVLDLREPPSWVEERRDPIAVRRVDEFALVSEFKRIAGAVFEKDFSFTAGQLADALRAGSAQHRGYVGYVDGEAAAVGRLYTHPDSVFGGLYGGGTLSAYRGRGVYRAVVAARARDAMAAGARYLIVDAKPTSRPILERMGFRWVDDTYPCEWHPPTAGPAGR